MLDTNYSAMVTLVVPQQVPRVIAKDADDDQVLACAAQARAHWIASGDQHLHSLGGNLVSMTNVMIQTGENLQFLDVSMLPTCTYFVRLEDKRSGKADVTKLQVVR